MAVFYTKSKNYEQQVAHASLYEVSPPLPMLSRGSLAAFDPRLGCEPHLRRSQRLLRVSCGSAGARSIILGPILSGRRLIWATPSQAGSLSWVGKPTWPFVCHRDAYYGKPMICHLGGWVGNQPSSSLCISNTRTDATVLWGIKYTCLTYFHPANMQVMQRCGLDEELISDLSKSLKD